MLHACADIGHISSHLKKITHPTPGGLGGYLQTVCACFRSLTSLHPLDGGVFKRTCIIHGSAICAISATSRHCSNVNDPRLCDRIIEIKLQVSTGDMKGIRHTSQTVKRCGHTVNIRLTDNTIIIRPPTGVAERRPGGLFHVMRRISQGSVSHTIPISRCWLTKD